MNFKQFNEAKEIERKETVKNYKPTAYLDMDGVLCDFKSPIAMTLGKQTFHQITNREFDDFFKATNVTDYFARLPMFPEGRMLIEFIIGLFGSYDICSCPLRHYAKQSIHGKNRWIKKNLDKAHQPVTAHYVFDKSKYDIKEDGSPNILIDDQDDNIKAWRDAGGVAIKFEADHGQFHNLVMEINEALESIKEKYKE
jgi:hypothetical protein